MEPSALHVFLELNEHQECFVTRGRDAYRDPVVGNIYAGNKPVGQLDEGQAQLLREQQRPADRKDRSLMGRISHVSELTNTFTVDITEK
jgi:hypothetical protein